MVIVKLLSDELISKYTLLRLLRFELRLILLHFLLRSFSLSNGSKVPKVDVLARTYGVFLCRFSYLSAEGLQLSLATIIAAVLSV